MSDTNDFVAFVAGQSSLEESDACHIDQQGVIADVPWNLVRFASIEQARSEAGLDFRIPTEGVLVRVEFSALNYKDALAATLHPGVARRNPLVPGIDAVGVVQDSGDERFDVGDRVLIANARFGTSEHGGWSEIVQVPGDWVYTIPDHFSSLDAVTWGTAGFTAAQSIQKILDAGIRPVEGPVVVSGATGGVGIFAVKLLAKLGYQVVASTGKMAQRDWLVQQGAAEVIARDRLSDDSSTPLLKGQWAAAVDTVGGTTLATILRSTKPHACVTACGLVAGHELPLTVYPFILRGVTLAGIDSAGITRDQRQQLWDKISTDWTLDGMDQVRTMIGMTDIAPAVEKILAGGVTGRTVIQIGDRAQR